MSIEIEPLIEPFLEDKVVTLVCGGVDHTLARDVCLKVPYLHRALDFSPGKRVQLNPPDLVRHTHVQTWLNVLGDSKLPDPFPTSSVDVYALFCLFDYLYGSDWQHPHARTLSDGFLAGRYRLPLHLLGIHDLRYHQQIVKEFLPGIELWPDSLWSGVAVGAAVVWDYVDFCRQFVAEGDWEGVQRASNVLRNMPIDVTCLTLPRSTHPMTDENMDRATGGLWRHVRPFLSDRLCWSGGSLVWSQLCPERDPDYGMDLDLFCTDPEPVRGLCERLHQVYGDDRLYYVVKDSLVNIYVTDITRSIQIIVHAPTTAAQIVAEFDMDYVRAYHNGTELRLWPEAQTAWETRQVRVWTGPVRLHRIHKARAKGFDVPEQIETSLVGKHPFDVFYPHPSQPPEMVVQALTRFHPGATVSRKLELPSQLFEVPRYGYLKVPVTIETLQKSLATLRIHPSVTVSKPDRFHPNAPPRTHLEWRFASPVRFTLRKVQIKWLDGCDYNESLFRVTLTDIDSETEREVRWFDDHVRKEFLPLARALHQRDITIPMLHMVFASIIQPTPPEDWYDDRLDYPVVRCVADRRLPVYDSVANETRPLDSFDWHKKERRIDVGLEVRGIRSGMAGRDFRLQIYVRDLTLLSDTEADAYAAHRRHNTVSTIYEYIHEMGR